MTADPRGDFGAILKRHRLAAGLSQEALAERASLSRRGVQDLERGVNRTPHLDTVALLAEALGLSAEEHAALEATISRRRGPPAGAALAPLVALPVPLTTFVGREREVEMAQALLRRPEVRLLTLNGPGGVGKTRLALRVGERIAAEYADGVYFVALASVSDSTLVMPEIAHVLGVAEDAGRTPDASLAAWLRERHVLLLLDNLEQVRDVGPALAALLAVCPMLKMLVTSRANLRVQGEYTLAVPPLAIPHAANSLPVERLMAYSAVRLFVERAQAIDAQFVLTPANAATVAAVCQRVEGLPLALELAAARLSVLPPRALLARLTRRLATLVGGATDLPVRQQTLRQTIAWSHDMLDDGARTVFRRLAVFMDGCGLDAAEAVCGTGEMPEGEVLAGLETLVDKSLLYRREGVGGEARFAMLETIREYAMERLLALDEAEATRRLHALYYLAVAESGLTGLEQQAAWLARVEEEHDNLRAALTWAREHGEREIGMRLAVALSSFWQAYDPGSEGRAWLEEFVEAGPPEETAPERRARGFA